ncbi:hypothetical protein MMPV_007120 [Pyropia vietnamensis]
MASAHSASCVFAVAVGGSPVRLHDAMTGSLRATYTPRHREEFLDPPHAVAWTAGGRQLLAGGARTVAAFDPARPAEPPLRTVGVRDLPPLGVVSCLASSPAGDGDAGRGSGVVVVGSFNGALLLLPSARGGGGGGGSAAGLCTRSATVLAPRGGTGPTGGGVMCVRVAADGVTVVAGARRSAAVGVWDIRYLRRSGSGGGGSGGGGGGTTTGADLLYELPVDAGGLQRLHLDVSSCGRDGLDAGDTLLLSLPGTTGEVPVAAITVLHLARELEAALSAYLSTPGAVETVSVVKDHAPSCHSCAGGRVKFERMAAADATKQLSRMPRLTSCRMKGLASPACRWL